MTEDTIHAIIKDAHELAKADAALVRRAEYPENLGRGKPYPKDE